jgi:hypothetical protein
MQKSRMRLVRLLRKLSIDCKWKWIRLQPFPFENFSKRFKPFLYPFSLWVGANGLKTVCKWFKWLRQINHLPQLAGWIFTHTVYPEELVGFFRIMPSYQRKEPLTYGRDLCI